MSEKLSPGTLCAVCDDIATGKHYSVPSCNGCKTFFRRALVKNREFICQGNGNCPVSKGVRCACRFCRLQKCLAVGMDRNSIQNDRDRIGYTKRKRKHEDEDVTSSSFSSSYHESPQRGGSPSNHDIKIDFTTIDPIADKLTILENNFTLLLSRCTDIKSYSSLEEALNGHSRFLQPLNCDWSDPIVIPPKSNERIAFWRNRLIALYIDWAKTFETFRSLPYTDKVALITNHASSFMIMCEAFRTPEHQTDMTKRSDAASSHSAESKASSLTGFEDFSIFDSDCFNEDGMHRTDFSEAISNGILFSQHDLPSTSTADQPSFNGSNEENIPLALRKVKLEPVDSPEPKSEMIRLPREYGTLPEEYGTWISKDYGHPIAGHEGRPDMHNFFDAREFCEGRPTSCSFSERSTKTTTLMVPKSSLKKMPVSSLSGVTPIMAMMIDLVMKPFRQLNVSTTEFALLQAVMFFDPDTEGIDSASQRNVIAEQKKVISVLYRHIQRAYSGTSGEERFSSILLRIPSIRRAAAKKNESLQVMDMLQLHAMNNLVKETSLGPRPTLVQQRMGVRGAGNGIIDAYFPTVNEM